MSLSSNIKKLSPTRGQAPEPPAVGRRSARAAGMRLRPGGRADGDLAQAIDLYRQSIRLLEQAGAPEAEHVWQRLTAAELKLKLEPVFQM